MEIQNSAWLHPMDWVKEMEEQEWEEKQDEENTQLQMQSYKKNNYLMPPKYSSSTVVTFTKYMAHVWN